MLKEIQTSDLGNTLYSICSYIGIFSGIIFAFFYRKKYRIPVWKYLIIHAVFYYSLSLLNGLMYNIESSHDISNTGSIIRALVFIPFIAMLLGYLLRLNWKSISDFFAPVMALWIGLALWGCMFAGCCYGYPARWGIYCKYYNTTAVPIQIFEAVTVLLIFAVLIIWNRKHKYCSNGKTYPLFLILFGSTRLIWEILRNNDKVWLVFSSLAFHSVFMVIVGIIAFFLFDKIKTADPNKPLFPKKK
ncbi:MAG: prolipoprotein diacylglyceryl transferase [Clostridia bacterium]|nr:prolipoprotein diacylglyceryl transferase [Clostridia bacterium]